MHERNVRRMDVFERRRAYLRALIAEKFENNQSALAGVLDVQSNLISRYLLPPDSENHKNIGERAARKMERKLGLESGAMDTTDVHMSVGVTEVLYSKLVGEERATYFGVPNSKAEAELGREWGKIADDEVRQQLWDLIFLLVTKQEQAKRGKGAASKSGKSSKGEQRATPT